jgi:hypothetical protein
MNNNIQPLFAARFHFSFAPRRSDGAARFFLVKHTKTREDDHSMYLMSMEHAKLP